MLSLLAAGMIMPVATAAADSATRYVDINNTSCSDTGTGAQAQPYCTIQAAADAAQPGDTVQVAPNGKYPATTITTSGAPGKPITIGGGYSYLRGLGISGAHDVTLRGWQAILSAGSLGIHDAGDITLDQMLIDTPSGSTGVEVSGLSSDVTVSRTSISTTGVPGIEVGAGVRRTVVTTDVIDATSSSGVSLDGAVDTAVTSNTFELTPHAMSVSAGSTGTTAENNVFYGSDIVVSEDSAATSTVGYNLFALPAGRSPYQWAGTAYPDPAAFLAATGQGQRDILIDRTGQIAPAPTQGSATVDSADADAPGELPTDFNGWPRVDDPLTPDTGNGAGSPDRGALELRDPIFYAPPVVSPGATAVGHPVTVAPGDYNPWGTAVTRTYDFGDGTPAVTSTAGSVGHTYTKLTAGKATDYTITVKEPTKTFTWTVTISPAGPLVAGVSAEGRDPATPLAMTFHDSSRSPFSLSTCKIAFGDGTSAVGGSGYGCESLQHTYRAAGTYTATITETDAGGRSASASTKVFAGGLFVPFGPTRILDTRTGLGARKAHVGQGKVVSLKVNGVAGITGATSVLLNVTATWSTGDGSITAYRSGGARPGSTSLTYRKGHATGNLVSVPVGADGKVNLFNSAGWVDMTADVEGYTTLKPGPAGGAVLMDDTSVWGEFRPVMDTTGGPLKLPKLGKLTAGKALTFTATLPNVNNTSYIEYQATAVVLQVTASHATAGTFVTAYKPGSKVPSATELSIGPGETRSATIVVPVDSKGRVSLYTHAGSVDVKASMEAFYLPFPVATDINRPMTAITAVRVLDTRTGKGAPRRPIPATGRITFKTTGFTGVPATATGVWMNVTAFGPTANGSLTVWGDRTYQPSEPAVTFLRGQTVSTLVYLPLTHGRASIYNPYGAVNVAADVQGYSTN